MLWECVHACFVKMREGVSSVDVLSAVNAFDEKYLNCHCA